MKIKSYSASGPIKGFRSQYSLLASDGDITRPLVYLQRPLWIKDDTQWDAICRATRVTLPIGFEVTV